MFLLKQYKGVFMKEIHTKRLFIRKFQKDDWKDLYEYLSDEKVVQYEPYGIMSENDCKKEAMERSNNDVFLAICLKDNMKLIGNLYFCKMEFDTYELGYVFNRSYQGLGYASESCKALFDHAFHNLKARRIIARCNVLNISSWKLLERLHMRREAHYIQKRYFKFDDKNNPIWIDAYQYAILAEEW
jgi:RimJ/RimL family protein N-acetyltransferase